MSAGDIEVFRAWRESAQIDFFSQFIKAWVAFNALMRTKNHRADSDRKLLEHFKIQDGRTKQMFYDRLVYEDSRSIEFRALLGNLHGSLKRSRIIADEGTDYVSFSAIALREPAERVSKIKRSIYECKVVRDENGGHKSIIQKETLQVFYKEQQKYDLSEIKIDSSFLALNVQARKALEECYLLGSSDRKTNLIVRRGGINVGSYRFDNNPSRLYSGLIEVLYLLRCALFHGRIVTERNIHEVYEYSYHIMPFRG